MLIRIERINRVLVMPVIRTRNQYRVNVIAVEDFSVIRHDVSFCMVIVAGVVYAPPVVRRNSNHRLH